MRGRINVSGFRPGNPRLAGPRGAIWIGLIGLGVTTVIGLIAVALVDWTKSTYAFNVWLRELNSPIAQTISAVLEEQDRPIVIAVILLTIGLVLSLTRGWLPALGFILVAGLGWLLIAVVKLIVREERPTPFDPEFAGDTPSYPSGHTVFAVTLIVALWSVLEASKWRPAILALGTIFIILSGLSRSYLGVHYPIDIIGGVIGGLSTSILIIGLWNRFVAHRLRARESA